MKKLLNILLVISALTLASTPILANADSTTGKTITSSYITSKIKAKLATTSGVSATDINVTTNEGDVVTLTGTVKSDAEKNLAEKVAKNTDGVKSVVNKLTVVQ